MRIPILILLALSVVAPLAAGAGAPSGKPDVTRGVPTIGPPAPGSAEAQRAKLESLRAALAEGRFAIPVEAASSSRPLPRASATPKPPETLTAEPFSGARLDEALRRQQEKIAALRLRPRTGDVPSSPGRAVSPDQAALKSGAHPLLRPLPAGPLTPAQRAKLELIPTSNATPAPAAGAGK